MVLMVMKVMGCSWKVTTSSIITYSSGMTCIRERIWCWRRRRLLMFWSVIAIDDTAVLVMTSVWVLMMRLTIFANGLLIWWRSTVGPTVACATIIAMKLRCSLVMRWWRVVLITIFLNFGHIRHVVEAWWLFVMPRVVLLVLRLSLCHNSTTHWLLASTTSPVTHVLLVQINQLNFVPELRDMKNY